MHYELNMDAWNYAPGGPIEKEIKEIGDLTWSRSRTITNALRLARGSGIYKIYQNDRLLYIGETGSLRDRFMKHRQCVIRFKVPGRITVRYARFTGPKTRRVEIQNLLINYYRNRKGFNITNVRELEEELLDID